MMNPKFSLFFKFFSDFSQLFPKRELNAIFLIKLIYHEIQLYSIKAKIIFLAIGELT